MKNLTSPEIAKFRDHGADRLYRTKDDERAFGGAFIVPVSTVRGAFRRRANLRVIASADGGWDHVSVSHSDHTPTWEEMDYIKRLFFGDDETVMQLHVPRSDWINNFPYCLHLWRPHDKEIPRPPAEFVGIPGIELPAKPERRP